jgi:hypothetical protein
VCRTGLPVRSGVLKPVLLTQPEVMCALKDLLLYR